MINRICASLIFISLLMAISLSLFGVEHVTLGRPVLTLLYSTSKDLETYKIIIPNIPTIPRLDDVSGFFLVLDVLIQFINGLVNILNFLVLVINTIIEVLEFIFILLRNLIVFRDFLIMQSQ